MGGDLRRTDPAQQCLLSQTVLTERSSLEAHVPPDEVR